MAIKAAIISTALTVSVIWFAITIAAYHFGYRMGEDYGDLGGGRHLATPPCARGNS